MLYLVSGTSRSGKTLIARELMKKTGVPYMSLDWLVMGFTNGVPEYGIHDKLWPNEIAERLWPFLQALLESILWSEADCIIEGEAILPGRIAEFMKNYPDKVRICFVGYADVNLEDKLRDVKRYSGAERDWLIKEPDEYIRKHIENMIEYSRMVKDECARFSFPYVDTSSDFKGAIRIAIDSLLG